MSKKNWLGQDKNTDEVVEAPVSTTDSLAETESDDVLPGEAPPEEDAPIYAEPDEVVVNVSAPRVKYIKLAADVELTINGRPKTFPKGNIQHTDVLVAQLKQCNVPHTVV